MEDKKVLVFIPTYNEKENVSNICQKILDLNLEVDILFLDDNSPDGTGEIIDDLAKQHSNIFVIHRKEKKGIGSAHIEGIAWAYDNDYTLFISMDCDFTHPPRYILDFIKEANNNYDVVIGSRYLNKDSLSSWNLYRKFLTTLGHFLTRLMLKMKFDATGAFRLYNLEKINPDVFKVVSSTSYSFFFESLYILFLNHYKIKEIPIDLPARTYGHSKMNMKDIFRSLSLLFQIYLDSLFNIEKYYVNSINIDYKDSLNDPQDWDSYWKNKKKTTFIFYDIIASFYRKFIIKPTLNYFIRKHFKKSDKVLHAGCGSGQVDSDIKDFISIHALDISREALTLYQKVNPQKCKAVHGSIFDIPSENEFFDGIYNLGVMEHFRKDEIVIILKEFHRILKVDGKIILFWPPEYGLSVIFLKFVHFVLNNILKRNIKLHPEEPNRVRSKKQIEYYLGLAKFKLVELYFGPRDFFTHAVVVAQKEV